MQTSITLPFADGEYKFSLPIKRIVAIEAKAGPIDMVKLRLMAGGWSINDVVEVLREGLIGGGKGMVSGAEFEVSDLKANSLIDNYVDGRPLAPNHIIARAIISALYVGYEQEGAQKKSPPRKPRSRRKSTGASSSTTA